MRSLLILSTAALAFALAQTTLIPALGELANELHTDANGVAWTLTGYLLSAAVFTPIFGRLGDMFGKRRLLVIALSVFAAGSAVSALGQTLEVLVAGRVLQGVGGGIFPLCFAIIRDEFPREKVSSSIGLISATFGIGGGAGLILGGVLVDQASYHWIFWLGGGMAAAAAVLTQLLDPRVAVPLAGPDRHPRRGRARDRPRAPAARRSPGQRLGLEQRADARDDRRRRGDPRRLGRARRSARRSRSPTSRCWRARPC